MIIVLIVSIFALAVSSCGLLVVQRNWLTLASTQRMLAETDRNMAVFFERRNPALAEERRQEAARHDERAVRFERRAWPWKPREDA